MREKVKRLLSWYKILPDPLKDQFFLVDYDILRNIIQVADIRPQERIIEIGPGLGLLTEELAKLNCDLKAIEIDKRFKPILEKLSPRVKIIYQDAWRFFGASSRSRISFDKLISNIPYSLCEPLMHKFTHTHFRMIILIIPRKFFFKILNHPIFSAFYRIEKICDIPKTAFYPSPKSNAVLVKITRLSDPLKTKNIQVFIRRYLYDHEQASVKNALREVVIEIFNKFYQQELTKNQARRLVEEAGINPELLEKKSFYGFEIYLEAAEKLEKKIKEFF